MKKGIRLILVVLLLAIALGIIYQNNEIKNIQAELSGLEDEMSSISDVVLEKESIETENNNIISELNDSIGEIEAEMVIMQTEKESLENELEVKNEELAQAKAEEEARKKAEEEAKKKAANNNGIDTAFANMTKEERIKYIEEKWNVKVVDWSDYVPSTEYVPPEQRKGYGWILE
ncbi:MAG: hypothetical protein IJZ36_05025 [Bacilli bacterium]|nr:hypothetical protein [Bacilli bacterium]